MEEIIIIGFVGMVGTCNPCSMQYPICPKSPEFKYENYIKWLKDNESRWEVSYFKDEGE